MRKGKLAAQVAHASLGVFFDRMSYIDHDSMYGHYYDMYMTEEMHLWKDGIFTKIVVGCEDESELLGIYENAKKLGLPVKLITDNGLTEFGGVKTNTCVAIGPADENDINPITGELKLL